MLQGQVWQKKHQVEDQEIPGLLETSQLVSPLYTSVSSALRVLLHKAATCQQVDGLVRPSRTPQVKHVAQGWHTAKAQGMQMPFPSHHAQPQAGDPIHWCDGNASSCLYKTLVQGHPKEHSAGPCLWKEEL